MSDAKKRKMKKSHYFQAKRQCGGHHMLDVGLKGFLITCNRMEKQTVREAYNLLNEYSCKLYGEETVVNDDAGSGEVDFNEAILSQVQALQGSGHSAGERQFQAVDTNTSNCIFIKTTVDHPDELVSQILSDVLDTGKAKARFILKIFPVLGTCRAVEDKIEKLVEELMTDYFSDRPLRTFATIYKVRCNNLSRDVILPTVGKAVFKACPTSKVDLANPDYVISVDILNRFACISIMKDFNKLKKYNLQELAKSESKATETSRTCEQSAAVRLNEVSSDCEDSCRQSELVTNATA